MKILAIRIKNLASLEGSTEIDFTKEPLSAAGIFAITGPTGAGKSTILDALCLALYGKTPRYIQAKESGIEIADVQGTAISQGDVRSILRDGTGEGYAEVDFVGVDGQQYKATWRVRRARDKAEGSLQPHTMALKNISTNTEMPGKKTELQDTIERLVGLNFEQFTRSVLLAQGDFTAFLKAAKDEKSSLLEKLTGTHIYSEISRQVYELYKQEEQELTNLNLQRAGIDTLTTEELGLLAEKQGSLSASIQTQEEAIEILNHEIAWHVQLLSLQSNLAAAQSDHEQALATKREVQGRELELKLVEQVQPVRTWVDSTQTIKNQLTDKLLAQTQLHKSLNELHQQNASLSTLRQQAADTVATIAKEQEEAKPLLEKAKELEIQIQEKTAQVTRIGKEADEIKQRFNEQQTQWKIQQAQISELEENIQQLETWKAENNSRQRIAENYDVIRLKLNNAQGLLDSVNMMSAKIEGTNIAIDQSKLAKAELEREAASIKLKIQTETDALGIASKALSAFEITKLENEKNDIDVAVTDIIGAEAHWKTLYNSQNILAVLKENLTNNRNALSNKTALLSQAVAQLPLAKAAKDSAQQMLDKARLAAAENVVSLRSQLIAGDPCPVCGSTEHPYTAEHEHPQTDRVLQELETAWQQYENQYAESLAAESSLTEACTQLKKITQGQELELSKAEAEWQQHIEIWKKFTIYKDVKTVPDEQKADWLAHNLTDRKQRQQSLQQQIKAYAAKKQELETLQKSIAELEKRLTETSNTIKDTERTLLSLQEQLALSNKEQIKSNKNLAEIEENLSGYFVAQHWFEKWKLQPAAFMANVKDFTDQWNLNTQKLAANTQEHGVLSATLVAVQNQLQALSDEVQKKLAVFNDQKAQQENLLQNRAAIFEGEPVATVEQKLKERLITAQTELETTKANWDKLQINIAKLSAQKDQTGNDIVTLQQEVAVADKRIEDWITSFNKQYQLSLDTDRLLHLLAFSAEWVEKERAALRSIDNTVTKAQLIIQERTAQLEQHDQLRLSARTREELTAVLSAAKESLQQQVQEKNEIGYRLQQDAANKQKIGELLNIIEGKAIIVENWAKLNEIIGSADGKKFRQIAQEYTLDILLNYANVHLAMLSKRYLLQRIPNSLGLQVLDQDMGNEIRTVFSLSGGESFLLSLALALGLASLSSSRMQVESLFIDEGFGSLDPATLNIAMDALERLHNQGRKVGVISHVQEMTERIPVQIQVSKESSGRSKVEVMCM